MIFTGVPTGTWVVGFFTVMRGSAFAAHAIPNGSFAGAAFAILVGVNTLLGLGVFSLGGAMTMACSAAKDATTSSPCSPSQRR